MLTVSQLVELLARITGIPEDLISRHARRLIDAGLLPKSTGRTIATVAPKHAFRLLIAAAASDRPPDAPRIVGRYSAMTPFGAIVGGHHNFGDEGAWLIRSASKLDYDTWRGLTYGYVRVRRHYPAGCIKRRQAEGTDYFPMDIEKDGQRPPVKIEAEIPGEVLLRIAAASAGMSYTDAIHEIRVAREIKAPWPEVDDDYLEIHTALAQIEANLAKDSSE